MSHIYQPVMLMALLEGKGYASLREIAAAILERDESQVEYYQQITRNMPARVLGKNHGLVEKEGEGYRLVGSETLSEEQREALMAACQIRLDEYLEARGKSVFEHRKKSSGYIPGTLRYDVLKAAKFRCELCGIPADEKALEVDHIVPRNKGGSDDRSNLQALCYSCNATKRDRDDTDFHAVRDALDHREQGCLFCEIPKDRVVAENVLAYAIRDGFPVTAGHTLVIPKRHVSSYFDLGRPEVNACNELLSEQKRLLEDSDAQISSFNVGINAGKEAGQTIFHCHIHLIPRRQGDMGDPKGGVRGVIPEKQKY